MRLRSRNVGLVSAAASVQSGPQFNAYLFGIDVSVYTGGLLYIEGVFHIQISHNGATEINGRALNVSFDYSGLPYHKMSGAGYFAFDVAVYLHTAVRYNFSLYGSGGRYPAYFTGERRGYRLFPISLLPVVR